LKKLTGKGKVTFEVEKGGVVREGGGGSDWS